MTNANPDDPRFYHRIKDHTSLRVFEGLIRVIINEPAADYRHEQHVCQTPWLR
ncbi:hypothetical protein M1N23_00375 [Dehalococcoidia bacterium]|nr:hypothetical protein [Dehalococcoidia bacterium]